jgi:hypothetical protein
MCSRCSVGVVGVRDGAGARRHLVHPRRVGPSSAQLGVDRDGEQQLRRHEQSPQRHGVNELRSGEGPLLSNSLPVIALSILSLYPLLPLWLSAARKAGP